jgi:hypothetical protein
LKIIYIYAPLWQNVNIQWNTITLMGWGDPETSGLRRPTGQDDKGETYRCPIGGCDCNAHGILSPVWEKEILKQVQDDRDGHTADHWDRVTEEEHTDMIYFRFVEQKNYTSHKKSTKRSTQFKCLSHLCSWF